MYKVSILGVFEYFYHCHGHGIFIYLYHFVSIFLSFLFLISNKSLLAADDHVRTFLHMIALCVCISSMCSMCWGFYLRIYVFYVLGVLFLCDKEKQCYTTNAELLLYVFTGTLELHATKARRICPILNITFICYVHGND